MFGLVGVDWNYEVVLLGAVTLTKGLKFLSFQPENFPPDIRNKSSLTSATAKVMI